MRGTPDRQLSMSSSLSTEDLIPADHPIRRIRIVVDTVLADLDDTFEAMYAMRSERPLRPQTPNFSTLLGVVGWSAGREVDLDHLFDERRDLLPDR